MVMIPSMLFMMRSLVHLIDIMVMEIHPMRITVRTDPMMVLIGAKTVRAVACQTVCVVDTTGARAVLGYVADDTGACEGRD